MSFALLVTAALIGPHVSLSADQWRDEYKATLLATAERAKPRPEEAVPRLVSLYVSLEHVEALPRGERGCGRRCKAASSSNSKCFSASSASMTSPSSVPLRDAARRTPWPEAAQRPSPRSN